MITVYSKENCPLCQKNKILLTNKGVNFEVINVDTNIEAHEFIVGQGHRSVPQIYKDGKLFVDGYNELARLSDSELKV